MKMRRHENLWPKPGFKRHYHRRGFGIDYHGPGNWHIIVKKTPEAPDFGFLKGDPRIAPGNRGCAYIAKLPLGRIIQSEILNLERRFDVVQIYQYQIMPDHVHILIRLKYKSELHLGEYVKKLKQTVRDEWMKKLEIPEGEELPYDIFQENYTDRIIHVGRSLDAVYRYIRENPYRLAIRKLYPEFFIRKRNIEIAGEKWQAYGNLFLLRNPFKSAVVIRSFFSAEQKAFLRRHWLWEAGHGGVLVSPFISASEKEIRDEAESRGAKIIHIQDQPFPELFKPEAHRFEQCEKGNLLILAPEEPFKFERFRQSCLHMNAIAQALACENWEDSASSSNQKSE